MPCRECGGTGKSGCEAVDESSYSSLLGIPLAAYGIFFYGAIAVIAGLSLAADPKAEGLSGTQRTDELGDIARATNFFVTEIGRRRIGAHDVITAEVADVDSGSDVQVAKSARELRVAAQPSAPSPVNSSQEA